MTPRDASRRARGRMSGGQLAIVLVLIALATAVIPPLGAWSLNRWRVERAAADVEAIAQFLRARRAPVGPADGGVVCGDGRLPKAAPGGEAWLRRPTSLQDAFGPSRPRDPWGRCYVANIGAPPDEPVLLVSAGPNGLIDTPLGAGAPHGDDVGTRVR